ncbi:hypothetical protein FCV25MIE_29342 [Fagus crenata]
MEGLPQLMQEALWTDTFNSSSFGHLILDVRKEEASFRSVVFNVIPQECNVLAKTCSSEPHDHAFVNPLSTDSSHSEPTAPASSTTNVSDLPMSNPSSASTSDSGSPLSVSPLDIPSDTILPTRKSTRPKHVSPDLNMFPPTSKIIIVI